MPRSEAASETSCSGGAVEEAAAAVLDEEAAVIEAIATVEAAKKVGVLKDKIGDAKALSDAFNPDAKFKALTQRSEKPEAIKLENYNQYENSDYIEHMNALKTPYLKSRDIKRINLKN